MSRCPDCPLLDARVAQVGQTQRPMCCRRPNLDRRPDSEIYEHTGEGFNRQHRRKLKRIQRRKLL